MALAGMIALDRDALICDLAETYGIYDMNAVPVPVLATLAAGLRDDSRIKTEIVRRSWSSDEPIIDINTMLLARIADSLAWLQWAQTKDAQRNRNKPKSILDVLMGGDKKQGSGESTGKVRADTAVRYDSPEDFMAAWNSSGGN